MEWAFASLVPRPLPMQLFVASATKKSYGPGNEARHLPPLNLGSPLLKNTQGMQGNSCLPPLL